MFSNRGSPLGFNLKTNPIRNNLYSNYYSDEFNPPTPPQSEDRITDSDEYRMTDDLYRRITD